MGTSAGQRVLGVLSCRRTFVRTSQLPPPSPPLSPFADSPFPRLSERRTLHVERRTMAFHSAFHIPHSAFVGYSRTQLLEVPQSKCCDVRAS